MQSTATMKKTKSSLETYLIRNETKKWGTKHLDLVKLTTTKKKNKKNFSLWIFLNQVKNKKPRIWIMKCRGAKCKNEINDMFSLNLKP
jgi:hypothetical protein